MRQCRSLRLLSFVTNMLCAFAMCDVSPPAIYVAIMRPITWQLRGHYALRASKKPSLASASAMLDAAGLHVDSVALREQATDQPAGYGTVGLRAKAVRHVAAHVVQPECAARQNAPAQQCFLFYFLIREL